ncbi:MAG: hypothetical protein PVI90_11475, partial [Desulfobacteraceae bacterium]|jgi:hypothetical protein
MHFHHDPDNAPDASRLLVNYVALGDIFVNIIKLGASGDVVMDKQLLSKLLEKVGITHGEVASLRTTIFKEIENAKVFLDIASKG